MRFGDLRTGDVMELAGRRAVLMAVENPHPKSPRFALLVWYLIDEKRFSFDMLDPAYEVFPGSRISHDGLFSWTQVASKGTLD